MRSLLACIIFAAMPALAQPAIVAAAANVKFALDEIVEAFRADKGQAIRVVYGSTGNLAQQIANGAPFEMLLSADETTIDRLAAGGFARNPGVVYAIGRLVLFVPRGSSLAAEPTLADLRTAVEDGRVRRFAIANPELAPYGLAAQQALQRAGAWDAIRPRLVLGESVSQAMQFAASGDTQGGLVPLALASHPRFASAGTHVLLPESMHAPLRQRMALLKTAGAATERFYEYLQGPTARALFVRHGYAVPGDSR